MRVAAERLRNSSAHKTYESKVGFDGHLAGWIAEVAFSRLFPEVGPPDERVLNGQPDFVVDGKGVEIKSWSRPSPRLVVKGHEIERSAVYVLVRVEGARATILGWATKRAVKMLSVQELYGKRVRVVPASALCDPSTLWTELPSLARRAA